MTNGFKPGDIVKEFAKGAGREFIRLAVAKPATPEMDESRLYVNRNEIELVKAGFIPARQKCQND